MIDILFDKDNTPLIKADCLEYENECNFYYFSILQKNKEESNINDLLDELKKYFEK